MNVYCKGHEMEVEKDLGSEVHVFPCDEHARIAELEAALQKIIDTCEECDDGWYEYEDGFLPTGDVNCVTEPCARCSTARALLAKGGE